MRIYFSILLCLAAALCEAGGVRREAPPKSSHEECGLGSQHKRIGLRYTTPQGIGYSHGYTTLEGFFAPDHFWGGFWIPFLDVRAHVFDSGRFAANAGTGLRYLTESRIWGGNIYYDYRDVFHRSYSQIAAGLESLGAVWDFRINGTLPFGKRVYSYANPQFKGFKGHSLLIERSLRFSMKGMSSEAGVHVDHFQNAPLYFAAGPYYLTGKGASTWGGEIRARAELLDRFLRLDASAAYDHFFKWTGQGQISLNFSFGEKKPIVRKISNASISCSDAIALQMRAVQPVDRSEIIPVAKRKVVSVARSPATGNPWFFVFVNNTSSSAGTYESPYPTLLLAQNNSAPGDVIYVYPGDGTINGMSDGITLKNGQLLLGASISHIISTKEGTIIIPPQASGLPNITNTSGSIVTLASDNTVAGFNMTPTAGYGITGTGISNFYADQNTLASTTASTDGINITNPTGQIVITNTTFNDFTQANGITINLTEGAIDNLSIANCSFNGLNLNSDCISTNFTGGTCDQFNISNCSFSNINTSTTGLYAIVNACTVANMNISGCQFNNLFQSAFGIYTDVSNGGSVSWLNVSDCAYNSLDGGAGIEIGTLHGSIPYAQVLNNVFTDITDLGTGIVFVSRSVGFVEVSGNTFIGPSTIPGYASLVTSNGSTTCLKFTNNRAPAGNPFPFQFRGTMQGENHLGGWNATAEPRV